MKSKSLSLQSSTAQTIKYALIAALLVVYLVPVPRVLAFHVADDGLPFGLQSGLVTAHLDPIGQVIGDVGVKSLPFGLQSGLVTAGLSPSGQVISPFALVGGTGIPFGLESGLVTAGLSPSGQVISPFALVGGTGIPFGLESGLVTAGIESRLSVDAGTARWSALGTYYIDKWEAASSGRWAALGESFTKPEVVVDASTARWAALGDYYTARSEAASSARWAALGAWFSGGDVSAYLAANPELSSARSFYGQGAVACSVGKPDDSLALNPELVYLNQSPSC